MRRWAKRGSAPSGAGWSLPLLTMPDHERSSGFGVREAGTLKSTMNYNTSRDDNGANSNKSHADRVRSQMNTTDLGAIMSRFYKAVSWRED